MKDSKTNDMNGISKKDILKLIKIHEPFKNQNREYLKKMHSLNFHQFYDKFKWSRTDYFQRKKIECTIVLRLSIEIQEPAINLRIEKITTWKKINTKNICFLNMVYSIHNQLLISFFSLNSEGEIFIQELSLQKILEVVHSTFGFYIP